MERRVLIAVFLSFAVLYMYQALLPAPKPAPARQERPVSQQAAAPAGATNVPGEAPKAPEVAAEKPGPVSEPVVADAEERVFAVENRVLRAEFSNRGAVLSSWRLKEFNDNAGRPLDLVPAGLPAEFLRPFALRLDASGDWTLERLAP